MGILGSLLPLGAPYPLANLGPVDDGEGPEPLPPTVAAAMEADVLEAAADLLEATKAFDEVYRYGAPEERGQRASDHAAVSLAIGRGSVTDGWDAAPDGGLLNRGSLTIVIYARHEDQVIRGRLANTLLGYVQNALNGKSLAGLTFAQATRVQDWTPSPDNAPEKQIRATLTFDYDVPAWDGYNTEE